MNLASGINAASTGAQLGSNFGALGSAIGGGVGLVAGLFDNREKAAMKQLDQFNKQVVNNTARSLFDLERQRVSERMRTVQALGAYQAQRSTALSSLKAQYGAMDVIGSSADAIKQAYSYQVDQALAQEAFNFEVGIDNYNTDVMSIVNQGLSQIRYSTGNAATQLDVKGLVSGAKDLKAGYSAAKGLFGTGGSTPVAGNLVDPISRSPLRVGSPLGIA